MHNYGFAVTFNAIAPEYYLLSIDVPVRLDAIPANDRIEVDILHGATPAAPTVMSFGSGTIVGSENSISIDSPLGEITLERHQLLDNPIIWWTEIDGVMCEIPIHYELVED